MRCRLIALDIIIFAQNSTRNLKQSQADNELDGQGSISAVIAFVSTLINKPAGKL